MPFKILKGFEKWDLIIKNLETEEELSLKEEHKNHCPICHYPMRSPSQECHPGLSNHIEMISFLTGHFYKTDYMGKPQNWFSSILKQMSSKPFRYSHEILKSILYNKIIDSDWHLGDIQFATMAPTTNQQMRSLFEELSNDLNLAWVPDHEIFIRRELSTHYPTRQEYVNNKYFLNQNIILRLEKLNERDRILIFDDVFHQGYTFGRLIDLVYDFVQGAVYLATIARTFPKSFAESFYFP
ncbi:MAG: hypothetical protein ACTSQI_16565 [Candidatus Helarchaeota archaeon]